MELLPTGFGTLLWIALSVTACGGTETGQAPGAVVPTTTDASAGAGALPSAPEPNPTAVTSAPLDPGAGTAGAPAAPGQGAAGSATEPSAVPTPSTEPTPVPSTAFFSDDFEAGRDPAWRESNIGGGSLTVDTSVGAAGSLASLRIDGNNGFHTMLELVAPAFAVTGNTFYGSTHVRVDQSVDVGHFVWIEAGTMANDAQEIRIGSNLGWLQVNHIPGDEDLRAPGVQLLPQTWHCLEFQFDGEMDALRVWLDNAEVTALSTSTFVAPESANGNQNQLFDWMPPFEAVRFGWELQGQTIWYDNIALGNERLGCP